MERVDWRGVGAYVALSYGLAWLVTGPLWLVDVAEQQALVLVLFVAMMGTPTLAALIVMKWVSPVPSVRAFAGLRLGRRWTSTWALMWLIYPAFSLLAPLVGAALGVYTLDLAELSTLVEMLESSGTAQVLDRVPVHALLVLMIFQSLLAPLLNAVPVLGEELGWRGYLLEALRPLGQWPALLLSGAIWGLWHAPAILLGHNYPDTPVQGVFFMVGLTVVHGVILGWARLRTGSVWPAVIGHGALNGAAGFAILLTEAGSGFDPRWAGMTGLTGWILPALFVLGLVVAGALPVEDSEVA